MHRLHLLICLIYGHRLPCCLLCYLTLSKPGHPHQKHSHGLSFRSQLHGQECFWWRWRESNPRPECLHFEGVTTIPSSFNIALNSFLFVAYHPHEPKKVVPGLGPFSLKYASSFSSYSFSVICISHRCKSCRTFACSTRFQRLVRFWFSFCLKRCMWLIVSHFTYVLCLAVSWESRFVCSV